MMAEPVTQGQFFERIAALEEKLQDNHRSQRDHVDERFDKLMEIFGRHEIDDRKIEIGFRDRLTTIETERNIEKSTASKHGAIAGTVTAGLIMGLIEAFKRLVTPPHP